MISSRKARLIKKVYQLWSACLPILVEDGESRTYRTDG